MGFKYPLPVKFLAVRPTDRENESDNDVLKVGETKQNSVLETLDNIHTRRPIRFLEMFYGFVFRQSSDVEEGGHLEANLCKDL